MQNYVQEKQENKENKVKKNPRSLMRMLKVFLNVSRLFWRDVTLCDYSHDTHFEVFSEAECPPLWM